MSTPHRYWIFSDESCINQSDYIVIGATVGSPETLNRMARDIENAEQPGMTRVMKWDKTKNGKLASHIAALKVFFDYNSKRLVDFHCLVIESKFVNYRKHSGGDAELGFGKFMFQLFLSMRNLYGNQSTYHCFPDFRDTSYDLQSLKRALNRRVANTSRRADTPKVPFVEIQWCDEADHKAAQINDMLTGAVGFLVNGRTQTGKDRSKTKLAEYVLSQCPHAHFMENSPWSEWHFRIWHYDLEK